MTGTNLHGLDIEVDGFSEQGPRPENQDALAIDGFAETGLIAVADGMGGEKSGRTAADMALEALRGSGPIRSLDDARRAIREADRLVREAAEKDPTRLEGMGCALGLLALANGGDGPGWIAAHVGDVRILSRSPDGVLRLETRDHTPAFARWEAGEITLDEIPDSTGANRLQRAVGRGGEADVAWLPAAPGWSWLIVSDGIYKAMRLDELARAMSAPTAGETCNVIRQKVGERGADDNYTAVIVHAAGGPAGAATNVPMMSTTTTSAPPPPARPRSAAGGFALALALIALGLAGAAFWTARGAGAGTARESELRQLRLEVDSLRAIVSEVVEPFGPSAPAAGPTAPTTTPQPSTAQ